MKENKKYLDWALLAFGGLGLEILIMMVEGMIYGTSNFGDWGLLKTLGHWTMTCAAWGAMSYALYKRSKKDGFDLLSFKEQPKLKSGALVLCLLAVCVTISYISWGNTFKPLAEFTSKMKTYGSGGWIAYLLQYGYYLVESILVTLVISFGQKFGEESFKLKWTQSIPWGGIVCGLTWGLMHTFSKGSLSVGLQAAFCAVLYGIAYLLLKKNVRYAYPIIALMFML